MDPFISCLFAHTKIGAFGHLFVLCDAMQLLAREVDAFAVVAVEDEDDGIGGGEVGRPGGTERGFDRRRPRA